MSEDNLKWLSKLEMSKFEIWENFLVNMLDFVNSRFANIS